jgi:hypothetical protein
MISSQTDFGVLLKEFRTKVNLKGVKLNTNTGHKEAQKQQKIYRGGTLLAQCKLALLN